MKIRENIIVPVTLAVLFILINSCASTPAATKVNLESPVVEEVIIKEEQKVEYKSEIVDYYSVNRESYFLNDGQENGYKLLNYNENGQLTGIENYKGSGDLLYKEVYLLDSEGRIIRSELYDNEGLTSYTLLKYASGNDPIEEEYYSQKDVYLSGATYDYNNDGLKTLWVSLDENKSPVLKSEYVYENKKLLKVSFLTPLNKEDGSVEYTYEDEQLVREVSTGSNGKEERKMEYEYKDGQLMREKLFQLGRLSRTNEFEYDENGNIFKMSTFNRSGNLLNTTEYEYLIFQKEIQVLVK